MFTKLFSNLSAGFTERCRKGSRRRKPLRPHLTIEALEARAVPAFLSPLSYAHLGHDIDVGDFNNDGTPDLLRGEPVAGVSVFLGNGDGTFGAPVVSPFIPSYARDRAAGDLNGDGNADLVTKGAGGGVAVYLSDGNAGFLPGQEFTLPQVKLDPQGATLFALGDMNRDGKLDVVVLGSVQLRGYALPSPIKLYVNVFLGAGDGTIHHKSTTEVSKFSSYLVGELKLADFNRDGNLDVLTAGDESKQGQFDPNAIKVRLLSGSASGKLASFKTVAELPTQRTFLAIADFNGDQKLDFISESASYPGSSNGTARLHLGDGKGSFQIIGEGTTPGGITADFNGDSKADMVAADPAAGTVRVHLGNGNGTFQAAQTFAGLLDNSAIPDPKLATADFNGDGRSDLVVASNSGFAVLINDGNWSSHSAPASHGDSGSPDDDPHFKHLWNLKVTEADLAWNITTGSTTIVVAVNDTGVDYTHPDLYKNIWLNQAEIPKAIRRALQDTDGDGLITFWDLNEPVNQGPGKITDLNGTGYIDGGDLLRSLAAGGWADGRDNGNNGYTDDLIGWDFANDDNDPRDHDGHGTLVAGIMGAVGNNGEGLVGVNWKVQIMPVKIVQDAGGIAPGDVAPAITYAAANGARVSNNSYGAPGNVLPPSVIAEARAAIQDAGKKGHLVVAMAGNNSSDNDMLPFLPGSFDLPNVIAVAATDRADHLASFSNFGATSVDLGAPGVPIYSTDLGGKYTGGGHGTSMATPHVTGAAALILSINPNLTYDQVKSLILDNVDPLPDLAGKTVTGGRLNIFKAVSATPVPLLANGVGPGTTETLTADQVAPLLTEALVGWQARGVDTSSLRTIDIRIANLGGTTLGMAAGNTIWLDDNAAGWGWFVDPTPWDDSEFTTPGDQGEQRRMDLLTVVAHEVGHLLGYEHEHARVMQETLSAGERLTLHGVDVSDYSWLFGLPDLTKKRDEFGWWM